MPAEPLRGCCPFGCTNADPVSGKESDFDNYGYCKHLVGFIELPPGAKAVGRYFEPLEPIYYPIRDADGKPTFEDVEYEAEEEIEDKKTGEKVKVKVTKKRTVPCQVHSGMMRLNGRRKQVVTKEHVIMGPAEIQSALTVKQPPHPQTGVERTIIPRLGIHSRVYHPNANTPVMTKPPEEGIADRLWREREDAKIRFLELDQAAKEADSHRISEDDTDEEAEAAKLAVIEHERMKETTKRPQPALTRE